MDQDKDEAKQRTIDCTHCIERMKSELLIDISHEFRTPLTLILGPLQDLEDGVFGQLGEQASHQVALARRNAGRVLELVDQLLDSARLDAGAMKLHARRGDLIEHLRKLRERFAFDAERRGIDLDFTDPGERLELWFDPDRLDKVFTNLISNALKFTPRGGTVRVSVETPGEGWVAVHVADDGPGISEEHLPRIFRRFYRAKSPSPLWNGTDEPPMATGTGLGLSLARDLAELHGGSLTAESIPGEGSTFVVRLRQGRNHLEAEQVVAETQARLLEWPPAGVGSVPPADAEAPRETAGDVGGQDRPLVLVVDDHQGMRAYLRRHLADRYRVAEAGDGGAALSLARELLPDLVLSDLMMPGMDGHDLCREIKSDPELDFVPVVLLTAKTSSESRLAGLEDGADDYLTKPFDAAELRARIDNLIASRRRLLERLGGADHGAPTPKLRLAPGVRPSADDQKFLADAQRAVTEHLCDEDLTVDVLAGCLAVDRSHLFRRLRELTGLTPSALIRELRLEQAAALILGGGSVSEVAWTVGFKDVSHFGKRFRARYRMTPSQYRAAGTEHADPLI